METEEYKKYGSSNSNLFKYFVTLILIATGVIMLARNFGYITNEIYDIVVSWSSMLIIGGIIILLKRNYFTGSIITLCGLYLLLDKIPGIPIEAQQMIWPTILILGGIFFFFHSRKSHFKGHFHHPKWNGKGFSHERIEDIETKDGYLKSENSFGAIKHVVLDDIFKGGDIDVSFGGTTIDLRRTKLQEEGSTININCCFSGIELYIPSDWRVVNKCDVFLGGCDDKRYGIVDSNKILKLCGNISFGGLEIKG